MFGLRTLHGGESVYWLEKPQHLVFFGHTAQLMMMMPSDDSSAERPQGNLALKASQTVPPSVP